MIQFFYRWLFQYKQRKISVRLIGHQTQFNSNKSYQPPLQRSIIDRSSFGKYDQKFFKHIRKRTLASIIFLVVLALLMYIGYFQNLSNLKI